jgi:DNA polymerase-4
MNRDTRNSAEHAPWSGPAILHVDLDAFFAAVEQLDHPEWRGLPVIVGGDPAGRGVVSTASYEARAFGVHSAMSSARAAALCPDAIWVRPTPGRYGEMSQAVFDILRHHSPRVQPVSIDEAFLDVTPGRFDDADPVTIARAIKIDIAGLGVTGSIGVSSSKTVSKIASDHQKPDGLTVVTPGTEAAFLAPLPVGAMSGVGPKTASRLKDLGIRTLGELAALDHVTALSVLGSGALHLVERAQGIDPRPVSEREAVKSVSNERTFSTDMRTPEEVSSALRLLVGKVASRLRRKGLTGRTVTVKLRFSDFSIRTVRRTLAGATDDEGNIMRVASALLTEAWTKGVGLRLLGVGVSGFEDRAEQLSLESAPARVDRPTASQLTRSIDAVRERFGDDALRFGRDLSRPISGESARTAPDDEDPIG